MNEVGATFKRATGSRVGHDRLGTFFGTLPLTNSAPPSSRRRPTPGAWLALLLLAWGTAICLHYGHVGLMPLDQSIVFDGGWRLLQGQTPFRDFSTPAGLVPIALQALFFRCFGVSWFVYCVHAAVFNGLFCVLAFRLLLKLEAGTPAAAFYALLSGVVFYPPFGVPYMDQHAFFFSLATIVALVEALSAPRGSYRTLALAAVPWLLVLAYLSKQIPSVLILPLAGLLPFLLDRKDRSAALRTVLLSTLALAVLLAVSVLAVDAAMLREALFTRPGHEGRGRVLALLDPAAFAGQAGELLRAFRLWSLAPTVLGASFLSFWRPRAPTERARLPSWFRPLLALYLLAICATFVMVTDNQGENGIPFVFLAAGLVHAELGARGRLGDRRAFLVLASLLAISSAWDTVRFDLGVNRTRMVHELDGVERAGPREEAALPPGLEFLEWKLHPFYRFTPRDLGEAVAFLRRDEGAIYVFGDLTILYALTGRPSAGESLWLHPGLTMPEPGEPGFAGWEGRLQGDLVRRRVRFFVRESRQTYNGLRLSQLPRLAAFVEAHRARRVSFGPIDVIELRP
jgi:hypothetical protein